MNARLIDGALAPFRGARVEHSFPDPVQTIYYHGTSWLGWNAVVNAVPGPVAQDRLYFTGDGAPKMRVGTTVYPLALPAPDGQPDVSIIDEFVPPALNDPDDDIDGWQDTIAPPNLPTPDPDAPTTERVGWWNAQWVLSPGIDGQYSLNVTWQADTEATAPMTTPPGRAPGVGMWGGAEGSYSPPAPTNAGTWQRVAVAPLFSRFELISPIDPANLPWLDPVRTPGEPHRLAIIREPVGGLIAGNLVTMPALAILDVNNDLIPDSVSVEVTVQVASGSGGTILGPTRVNTTGGLLRFRDLRLMGLEDEPYVLRFSAPGLEPVLSGEVLVAEDPRLLGQTTVFAYTMVTEFGEESAPSPLSESVFATPSNIVRISGLAIAPIVNAAARGVTHFRIYRSVTGASGVTDLYFVAEVPVASASFDHDIATPLGEVLPSADYDTPPDTMRGLISMANGMMAAFDGKSVRFCEPFRPHAWPTKYEMTTDYDVVGLASFGTTLAIMTKGTPYVSQGYSPSTMAMEKIEQNLPCVSARSIVDLGYSAAFATHEGLVVIGQGGANVVTKEMFSRDQWHNMTPSSIIAEQYGGRYVFSYQAAGNPSRSMGFIDLTTGQQPFFMEADAAPNAFFHQLETGELFFIEGAGTVKEWDARASLPLIYTWKSKLYSQPALQNFGAIYIESDEQTATAHGEPLSAGVVFAASIYADGNLIHQTNGFGLPARLPSGFLATDWEVRVEANVSVTSIWLAGSIDELSRPM
ncbi:hypothetical protein [Pararhodobacter sp.]|uniref:hypothetical protein n=1 Tax=Pararhodobacter sp. TaxID=2127056 RepID=UPI002FDED3D5